MAALLRLEVKRTALIQKVHRIRAILESALTDPTQLISVEVGMEELTGVSLDFNEVQSQIEVILKQQKEETKIEDQLALREQFETEVHQIKVMHRTLLPTTKPSTSQPERVPHPSNVHLPKLNLPVFAGDHANWTNFSDLFLSLIDQNMSLSPIEKFHYLKLSLIDEPLQLIKNIPVNAHNYTIAWDQLTKRYANQRPIVERHLERLFDLPTLHNQSFSELKGFVNTINENVSALSALDLPVASWSCILAALVVRKLDAETRTQWELTLQRNVLPKFTELMTFLDMQIGSREWQSIAEKSKPFVKPTGSRTQQPSRSSNWRSSKTSTFVTNTVASCVVCTAPHSIYNCKSFKDRLPRERIDFVKRNRLCFNCLSSSHSVSKCRSTHTCSHCHRQHHTLLHLEKQRQDQLPQTSSQSITDTTNVDVRVPPSQEPRVTLTGSTSMHSTVLLATAVVSVQDLNGTWQSVRALLDSASQASYISESCLQRLNLNRRRLTTPIYALGDVELESSKGITSCHIRPQGESSPSFTVNAIVVRRISGDLPSSRVSTSQFSHLKDLKLADPHFDTPGRVDMLIGADLYPHVVLGGRVLGAPGSPVGLHTTFGWVIMGEVSSTHSSPLKTYHLQSSTPMDQLLQRFWEIEEVQRPRQPLTEEDTRCESIFQETCRRDETGRYTVSLPFVVASPQLGDSYQGALQCYRSLRRRLQANPALHEDYTAFMQDYLDSGHMTLVRNPALDDSRYFIPHHCILKPESVSTKLRVVFNASKKTTTQLSLNDVLLTGPALQLDLASILIRFRWYSFVLTADIRQMYRQILIEPEHRSFQRILWSFDHEKPDVYELNTVTYGMNCAPYLAIRTLQQLATDEEARFPLAVNALRKDTYVDDVITGCNTLQEAIQLQQDLSHLLAAGGFDLRKWAASHPDIISSVPASHQQLQDRSLNLESEPAIKILGLQWSPIQDSLGYKIQPLHRGCSKRIILSEIARIFDPIGLLTPLTMLAKRILQRLWMLSLDWDDPPPIDVVNRWTQFQDQLSILSELKIPRLVTHSGDETSLIGFCDASEAGYAAVIYVRTTITGSGTSVTLLCAKSRVAPLKKLSLPRLELCAALLLARLFKFVKEALPQNISQIYAWSDSTVALTWMRNSPHRWKTFVGNRVAEIQSIIRPEQWFHVRSADNPADCGSRGLLPHELMQHTLYWNGPAWLLDSPDNWPVTSDPIIPDVDFEETKITLSTLVKPLHNFELLNRYSTLSRLQRITAYCRRFYHRCRLKGAENIQSSFLTAKELNEALLTWILLIQSASFASDLSLLKKNRPCSPAILKLNPFIDQDGILRVGGRIRNSILTHSRKHPILLPPDSPLTSLIIDHYHKLYLHPGSQTLQHILAQRFWILSARRVIRNQVRKCLQCFRCNPQNTNPMMGDLPVHRVTQLKPFEAVGIDYGGPFAVTSHHARGVKTQKAYLCLFVCFATKALHLELVSSLSTDAFLAAFRRFIARRGRCSHVYSDCGTNFVGAKRYLAELYVLLQSPAHNQVLSKAAAERGIEWHLNPPSAPHFGGIWEAGIKSVKTHLYRVIGEQVLTYEELNTVFIQIEALLNSRPLCALSADPNDLSALTPGHFLLHESPDCIPEPDLSDIPLNRLTRWQLIQRLQRDFWHRWHMEYLNSMQQRAKWLQPSTPIVKDTLVLIKDNLTPPIQWRLGRVITPIAGSDGIVRVATVRTASGTLTRPVVKLCPLPLN